MDDGLAGSFPLFSVTIGEGGLGVALGAPLPRAIPCAASTRSTTRAIVARSTLPAATTAGAGGAAAGAIFFSSGFAPGKDSGALAALGPDADGGATAAG